MVQKILEDYTFDDEFYSTPLATGTVTTPVTSNTPFESCTVSPAESCQVSKELNPEDYFLEYSDSLEEDDEKKKSWTTKLRLMKQSSLGTKIKASRAYLRSFFGKTSCSDESSCALKTNSSIRRRRWLFSASILSLLSLLFLLLLPRAFFNLRLSLLQF
jgi:hypothetical protein